MTTKYKIFLVSIFIDLLLLDFLTKLAAINFWKENPVSIIGDFFELVYHENYGIAFGLELPKFILLTMVVVFLVVMPYLFKKEFNVNHKITQASFLLVMAGGIGNLIDRLIYGYVVDFISIGTYPIFNVADIYVVVGVLLLIVFYGKISRKQKPYEQKSNKSKSN